MEERLKRLMARDGITCEIVYGANVLPLKDAFGGDGAAHGWRVTLRRPGGHVFMTDFFGGEAVKDVTPEEVMECLVSDALIVEVDEIDDLGLTYRQMKTLESSVKRFKRFLGDLFDEYLYGREDDQ